MKSSASKRPPIYGEKQLSEGVREIRICDAAGAFRVLYVAKFDDAVCVLHCFRKKMQKTSKADLNLAAQRYRDLLRELGEQETLRQCVGCN
jgi:phage-related protein